MPTTKDSYLLAHKFGDSEPHYISHNEYQNYWEETYSPYIATEFKNAKSAIKWSKDNTTFGEYAVALESKPEKAKFDEWMKNGMVRRRFNIIDKKLSRKYKNETPEEVLVWYISVREDVDGIRYEDYQTWPKLHSVFKHLFDRVSYYSKRDDGKLLHSFSVSTRRDGRLEDFKKELNLVLPHITYLDNNGDKIINVFDHYLSEHGNSVSLIAHKNGKFSVEGKYNDAVTNADLEKCFNYLKRERYYE